MRYSLDSTNDSRRLPRAEKSASVATKGVGCFIPDTAIQLMSATVEAYPSRETTRAVKADCSGGVVGVVKNISVHKTGHTKSEWPKRSAEVLQVPKRFCHMKGASYPTAKSDRTLFFFLSSNEKHPSSYIQRQKEEPR